MTFDLMVQNGTVIDGTGNARFRADLGVKHGLIAEIAPKLDARKARRTIDASGRFVAPGVIDLHTHYDAQIHWDPYCTGSSWHGTTTVVVGNCGFGFAPCEADPEVRDRYMLMMHKSHRLRPRPARLQPRPLRPGAGSAGRRVPTHLSRPRHRPCHCWG